jgi:hypothetical protein
MEKFAEGFLQYSSNQIRVHYLAESSKIENHVEAFHQSEYVVIIFPLYTDAMPAIVKRFLENIYLLSSNPGKNVGFIIQSGFPEAYHSFFVKKYLEKLTLRLQWQSAGTVIKGGVEGIQIMPFFMTRKLFRNFYFLGKYYAHHGCFSDKIVEKLGKPVKFSYTGRAMFRFMQLAGFSNFYWNKKLKEHGAYTYRHDQPYKRN